MYLISLILYKLLACNIIYNSQLHHDSIYRLTLTSLTSDFAYWYGRYYFVVCLSVTFVHCVQTAEDIDMISFAYDSSMSLLDSVDIGWHWSTPSSPNFTTKWPTPFDYSVWDMTANCGRMFRESSNGHNGQPHSFKLYHCWSPTTSPSPKWVPNTPQDQLRDACCHLIW